MRRWLGGSIFLGVLDDGAVEGIDREQTIVIERDLVNVIGNPKLFNRLRDFQKAPDRIVAWRIRQDTEYRRMPTPHQNEATPAQGST
ncbi:hypothetical protein [Bifidobacterium subtile]|uniref:hypothetical protein n=1 Tax=Bifidobacterium subtile TaxID=77635 RepID=UPI002F355EB6